MKHWKGEDVQVEYEPRSESFRVWVSSENEYNFMKLIQSPAFDPYKFVKNYQNSIYGKMVSVSSIDGKESDKMNKDYIVVHDDNLEGVISVAIIFKSKIAVVQKAENGTATIRLDSMAMVYTADKYEDIIKQLI